MQNNQTDQLTTDFQIHIFVQEEILYFDVSVYKQEKSPYIECVY